MAYQVISQNNTTTTLADENGNIIRVPARVSLATSTDYTIKKVNNTTATLEDGNGNIIRDVPCVAVLVGGEGGGGGAVSSVNGQTGDVVITGNDVLPDQTGQSGKFLTTDGTDASWSDITKVNSTITLAAAGWSSNTQTVTVNGVTSTSVVFVAPDPADTTDYVSAGILCTAQGSNSLTFTATTTPSADIDVVVVAM